MPQGVSDVPTTFRVFFWVHLSDVLIVEWSFENFGEREDCPGVTVL